MSYGPFGEAGGIIPSDDPLFPYHDVQSTPGYQGRHAYTQATRSPLPSRFFENGDYDFYAPFMYPLNHSGREINNFLADRAMTLDTMGPAEKAYVEAVYAACFCKGPVFDQAKRRLSDPAQIAHLDALRAVVAEEMTAATKRQSVGRDHYARKPECDAAPIDLHGADNIAIAAQMSPDDWHEIALTWNWGHDPAVLMWIAAQPTCDRAHRRRHLLPGRAQLSRRRPPARPRRP